jgi:hypothetical protein
MMERVISEDGVNGVMVSGDEIDKVIFRQDRRIDLFMKGGGCLTIWVTGKIKRTDNAICELAPAEENPNWENSPN